MAKLDSIKQPKLKQKPKLPSNIEKPRISSRLSRPAIENAIISNNRIAFYIAEKNPQRYEEEKKAAKSFLNWWVAEVRKNSSSDIAIPDYQFVNQRPPNHDGKFDNDDRIIISFGTSIKVG